MAHAGALQILSIHGLTLRLGRHVAGLLGLHHLQQISFSQTMLDGCVNNACFAALIYNLARHRPQVKVQVHLEDLLEYSDVPNADDDSS